VTFLVDYRLYDLPFESISIFNKIPYKSNDFSLNTNIMRLKNINYNPTQNANGISLPGNVKYYLDYHSEQKIKYDLIKILTDNLNTGSGGAKKGADQLTVPLEGVLSTEHKPSIQIYLYLLHKQPFYINFLMIYLIHLVIQNAK